MLIDLENIVGFPGYYIDDQTYEIWSFKQKKDGKRIKLCKDNNGYYNFIVHNEGKRKTWYYHQLIVKVFIDPDYNPKTQEVDHINHIRDDNRIENLKVVSRKENLLNRSSYSNVKAIYLDDIGETITVNAGHCIYYSNTFDKFYRFVEHIGKYRQFTETKNHASMQIVYKYNNKAYRVNCTKFRQNL